MHLRWLLNMTSFTSSGWSLSSLELYLFLFSSPDKIFSCLLLFLRNTEYLFLEFDNPSTAFEKIYYIPSLL